MPQRPIVLLHGCSDRAEVIHFARFVPPGNKMPIEDLAACVC